MILARIYPRKVVKKTERLLGYAGIETEPGVFLTAAAVASVLCGGILTKIIADTFGLPYNIMLVLCTVLAGSAVYLGVNLKADARGGEVATVLPDALKLMAANLRAGLPMDKALFLSIREEFGPLNDEIRRVYSEVTAGEPLNEALLKIKERLKSRPLELSINIINHGLRAGGMMESSLDKIADTLREREFIRKEISSSVMTTTVLILFAVSIGAPLLYAISSFFVSVMGDNMMVPPSAGKAGELAGPLAMSGISISAEFLTRYSLASLSVIAVVGSLIAGLINAGKVREGFKYIPFTGALSITLYLITKIILNDLFGGIMT